MGEKTKDKEMKTHELKLIEPYFTEVMDGRKRAEIRQNDRDFQLHDILILREYDQEKKQYGQRNLHCYISHILKDVAGLDDSYVILSISNVTIFYNR